MKTLWVTGLWCLVVAGCLDDSEVIGSDEETATVPKFSASAVAGAGFQNTIARSPFTDASGQRPLLVGADIAGLHRSVDGGASWRASMVGAGGATHVSSVYWSPATSGRAWVAADGGLFRSDDFGQTWTLVDGAPAWNSNNPIQIDGNEHPRAVGQLIAESSTGSDLWIATYSAGVWHSADHGASWDHKLLTSGHIARGVAMDPAHPATVYVAMVAPTSPWNDSVYRITNASTAPVAASIGGPARPEELILLGGKLYAAAESAGVWQYDGAWHDVGNGDLTSTQSWMSLDGYVNSAGKPVIVAGSGNGSGGTVRIATDPRNGGRWTNLTTGPGATTMYGGSTTWWAATNAYCHFNAGSFVASQLLIAREAPATMWLAGRCGVWRTDNTGASWAPAVYGLNVTVNHQVVADPNTPGRAYNANMDWTFFATNDHYATVQRSLPDSVSAGLVHNYGTALAVDADSGSPATVYLGAGNSRPAGVTDDSGEVYSNRDPLSATGAWVNEGLHPHTNGGLVFNLGVGHYQGARVILATVAGSGFWRKQGSTWTKITSGPFASGAGTSDSISWTPGNTGVVYAHDPNGVWRSKDGGKTWTRIVTSNGGVAWVDPTQHARIYYTTSAGTFRLDNAATVGAGATGVKISSIASDLMTVSGTGHVYIAQALFTAPGAHIWRSTNPTAATPAFTDISDAYYRGAACNINWLAAGPDDYLYTSSSGGGINVGSP